MKLYAEIIVDNMSRSTDLCYTYLIPHEYVGIISIGMRVLVPFGNGDKLVEGIVLNVKDSTTFETARMKYIDSIIDNKPILSNELVELAKWMKDKYLAQYIETFKTIIPSGITKKVKKFLEINDSRGDLDYREISSKNEENIIKYLQEKGTCDVKDIRSKLGIKNVIKYVEALEKKGYINTYDKIESAVKKKFQKVVYLAFHKDNLDNIVNNMNTRLVKQKEILKYISKFDGVILADILEEMSTTRQTINNLAKKGLIDIKEEEVKRNPLTKKIPEYKKVKLTSEQQMCVESIYNSMIDNSINTFLIHGVTGSGKTEIYLQLIEKALKDNKQSIVLVPEISLTPQTVERFVGRFGERVAILHSRLSLGERFDEWQRIKDGEVDIVVGARSAVFAPFSRLGLIIIDEEHETSYKSSMNPKYNTVEVAQKRCELEGASLILGSATPSIETYYKAKNGEIELLTLSKRANNKNMPPIEIVDMKDELDKGNKSIFSEKLYNAIKENLDRGKQTILFLNRRGFSTFVSCRKCGYVAKCKNCDISLTYHSSKNTLICHYCGLSMKPPTVCPECGSKYIKYFGIGTQRVEEMVKKHFPVARIARMDVDTTTRKGSHDRILSSVKNGEVDILIGTQMISKGLDFPNVTLVGVLAADMSLNLPDFRASERTFQLITQVGGRAGRGDSDGRVILQTYEPNHYSIEAAQTHDYISFYEKEILLRKEFNYPPFTNIINITIIGKNEREVSTEARKLANDIIYRIKKFKISFNPSDLLGPNPAPIAKIKNNYRWQIVLKCSSLEIDSIKSIIEDICINEVDKEKYDKVRFSIDINPVSIM